MPKPLISIIIPVFNVEKYIARCLNSAINQTLADIEIIIVDDCGSDNSMKIAENFAARDPRIKIIHHEQNKGTFAARISGINAANGRYVMFVDSDDFLALNACEVALNKAIFAPKISPKIPDEILEQNIENLPDIVFFGMQFFPPTFKKVSPKVITKPLCGTAILEAVLCATPPWHICAKLYKASHIKFATQILVAHMGEGVRLTMAEDALKSFVVLATAKKSVGIDDKLYFYCENASSITRKFDAKTRDKKIKDYERVIEFVEILSQAKEVAANKSAQKAKRHFINIFRSEIVLLHRYDGGLWAYLSAVLKSLKYHRKWQTFVRFGAALVSFGRVKI